MFAWGPEDHNQNQSVYDEHKKYSLPKLNTFSSVENIPLASIEVACVFVDFVSSENWACMVKTLLCKCLDPGR